MEIVIFFCLGIFLGVLGYFALRPSGWYHRWRYTSGQLKIVTEDLLKYLYLQPEHKAETEQLQRHLSLTESTMQKILTKMTQQGWLQRVQQQLELTPEGKRYALEIIRAHRLYEHFLAEKTGYEPTQWHKQAEKMEHRLTDEQLSAIIRQIGNPRYDPHGDPIPTEVGKLHAPCGEKLNQLKKGTYGRIIHIEDEPTSIYQQILDRHIHVGSIIRVLETNTDNIVFYSEGEEFALDITAAENITIHVFDSELTSEQAQGIRLSSLSLGEKGQILSISAECRGANRRRLLDLGFVRGSEVKVQMSSPLANPKAYLIRNTLIALRDDQAKHILIKKITL